MDITAFEEKYSGYRLCDKISISCDRKICECMEVLNKGSALRNVKKNGEFVCRKCAYTKEGRKKISKATSYKRSAETKAKMSASAKRKWTSEEGQRLKKNLSKKTAEQQRWSPAIQSRRHTFYPSTKAGLIYLDSSYELRAAILLDQDDNVITYESQISFETESGRGRRIDFLVTYKDNSQHVLEVKPHSRLGEYREQINDIKEYAQNQEYIFSLWTEEELGFDSPHEATKWADEFMGKLHGIDYVAIRKERRREDAKRHYQKKISSDRVEVFCDYCDDYHYPLRLTYDRNIERNGDYICERYGGHLSGTKGNKKKDNPYADEGKKQCAKCEKILSLNDFGKDKSRRDGYASRCKKCRAKVATEKYRLRK